jgi:DNA-directed RNA polymerase subunit F
MISKLLQKTSVQHTADIMGHKDIRSTLAYKRFSLNKEEIQNLLDEIDQKG